MLVKACPRALKTSGKQREFWKDISKYKSKINAWINVHGSSSSCRPTMLVIVDVKDQNKAYTDNTVWRTLL